MPEKDTLNWNKAHAIREQLHVAIFGAQHLGEAGAIQRRDLPRDLLGDACTAQRGVDPKVTHTPHPLSRDGAHDPVVTFRDDHQRMFRPGLWLVGLCSIREWMISAFV